ncbi:MAG: hypothetical protein JW940_15500, partial [Polyangiaceae bacterium]|nr:hypothetical protein [Polyangiaceae bacterium]
HAADHAKGDAENAPSPAEGCVFGVAATVGKLIGALDGARPLCARVRMLVACLQDTPHNQKPVSWPRLRALSAELDGFAPFEAVEFCGESR